MLGEAAIRLRLRDSARGRDRAYEIEVDRDLFGAFTVTISHGRWGVWSVSRRVSVAGKSDAVAIAATRLRRRSTARRRLGAGYELVAATGGHICGLVVGEWHRLGGADCRVGAGEDRPRPDRRSPAPGRSPALPLFGA